MSSCFVLISPTTGMMHISFERGLAYSLNWNGYTSFCNVNCKWSTWHCCTICVGHCHMRMYESLEHHLIFFGDDVFFFNCGVSHPIFRCWVNIGFIVTELVNWTYHSSDNQYQYGRSIITNINNLVNYRILVPVVPHKAVAEVSKIVNL